MLSLFGRINKIFYYLILLLILVIGLFLRIRLYLYGYPLWHDEIMLHYNIFEQSFSHLFKSLYSIQVAPPIYLCIVKVLTDIFGHSVYVLRFISIVSGCLSLILFLPFLIKMFKNKFPIVIGLFLFSVNAPLIHYSAEFKPYSTDVLIFILLFLLYNKINLANKKDFILGIFIFFILPFLSFSSFIVFGSILLVKTIEIIKSKTNYKRLVKISILAIILLFSAFILYKINENNQKGMIDYHHNAFVSLSFLSFNEKIKNFLEYMGYNSNISLFLLYAGIFLSCFSKNKIVNLSVILLILILFASLIKIYPFDNRMILFLVPVFIFFIVKLFEFENNKISIFKSILLCLLFFYSIPIKNNINFVIDVKDALYGVPYNYREEDKDEIIKFLQLYKPKEKYIYWGERDFLVCLNYYNKVYNFNKEIDNINLIPIMFNDEKEITIKKIENEIKNNKNVNYWISSHLYEDGDKHLDIENIIKNLGVKYKIFTTKNGNLYYIEK